MPDFLLLTHKKHFKLLFVNVTWKNRIPISKKLFLENLELRYVLLFIYLFSNNWNYKGILIFSPDSETLEMTNAKTINKYKISDS